MALARLENPTTIDSYHPTEMVTSNPRRDRDISASHLHHTSTTAYTTRFYIANVGDARAVLCRSGFAIDVTRDHRVSTRPDEIARIIAAGGWVRNDRVLGVLGVTRAFGDSQFKASGASGVGISGPSVIISDPDIRVFDVSPLDEFLIFGMHFSCLSFPL